MYDLRYHLICPYDVPIIEALIQETDFSELSLGRYAPPIYVATYQGNIVGFTFGQKGYGDDSHILTIHGTYLRHFVDDEQHLSELQVAFINWAKDALKVTHYCLSEAPSQSISEISPPIPNYTAQSNSEASGIVTADAPVSSPVQEFIYN